MARERSQFWPAIGASVLLHVGVGALLLISWPEARKSLPFGSPVPVNIVSDAPMTSVAPAIEGEEQEAMVEEPLLDEPPAVETPPAPDPLPAETPAKPKSPADKAKPTPSPKPKPKQQSELNFDDVESRLQRSGGGQNRPGGGKAGPKTPPAAPKPRPDGRGRGVNASNVAGLQQELQRRWNPNCDVEGGRSVKVTVQVVIAPSGYLIGEPKIIRRSGADDNLVGAGATRAIAAVKGAQPFRDLPDDYIGEQLNLNFDAVTACSL